MMCAIEATNLGLNLLTLTLVGFNWICVRRICRYLKWWEHNFTCPLDGGVR